jgi:hypothetical protein
VPRLALVIETGGQLEKTASGRIPNLKYELYKQGQDPFAMSCEEDILLLTQCIGELPGLEKKVLVLYYLENILLVDIAAGFGLSEARTCRILVGTIDLLQSRVRRIPPNPDPRHRQRTNANEGAVASRDKTPQELLT